MVFLILLSLVSYADLQNASTVIYRPENTYRSHSFIADQFADLSNKSFLNLRFVTTAGATPDGQTKYMWQFPSEVFRDPDVGHSQRPQSQVRHIIRTENELLYDVVYTFDEYGRRSTPLTKQKPIKNLLLYSVVHLPTVMPSMTTRRLITI